MASATAAVSGDNNPEDVLRSLLDFADVFEFANGYEELDYGGILNSKLLGISSAKAESRAAMSEVAVGENASAIAWAFEGADKVQDEVRISETLNGNDMNGRGNVAVDRVVGGGNEEAREIKEAKKAVKAAVAKLDDVITYGLLHGVQLSTLPQLLSYEHFELYTGCSPDLFQEVIDSGWVNAASLNSRVARMYYSLSTAFEDVL